MSKLHFYRGSRADEPGTPGRWYKLLWLVAVVAILAAVVFVVSLT